MVLRKTPNDSHTAARRARMRLVCLVWGVHTCCICIVLTHTHRSTFSHSPLHEPHAARQSTPKTALAHSTSTAALQLHTHHAASPRAAKPPEAMRMRQRSCNVPPCLLRARMFTPPERVQHQPTTKHPGVVAARGNNTAANMEQQQTQGQQPRPHPHTQQRDHMWWLLSMIDTPNHTPHRS